MSDSYHLKAALIVVLDCGIETYMYRFSKSILNTIQQLPTCISGAMFPLSKSKI